MKPLSSAQRRCFAYLYRYGPTTCGLMGMDRSIADNFVRMGLWKSEPHTWTNRKKQTVLFSLTPEGRALTETFIGETT